MEPIKKIENGMHTIVSSTSSNRQFETEVNEFYSEWIKRTKRGGSVLIGSTIKQLLIDFAEWQKFNSDSTAENKGQQKGEIKDIELFKEFWYKRYPAHENNADTGEDMFWGTAELVAREYVEALNKSAPHQERNTLQEDVERLGEALEKISTMQLNSQSEAEGRFYDCIGIAEEALNQK